MFLECIGNCIFWIKVLYGDNKTLYLNHTFQKQTALSQFEIATAQGLQKLSIPTVKATRKGLYNRVEISYDSNWQVEHWRTIENAYQKSPFFIFYNYKIEPVFKTKYTYLYEFNLALLKVVMECMKLNKAVEIDFNTPVYYAESSPLKAPNYPQVFDDKLPFLSDLSVLDLLFNLGPEASDYLMQVRDKNP
jgi:hypothetical protein